MLLGSLDIWSTERHVVSALRDSFAVHLVTCFNRGLIDLVSGYVQYVKGQIKNVGLIFYGLDIDIELLREEFLGSTVHVTMQLRFDNSAFLTDGSATQDIIDNMKIESEMFFEAFPFHIVFTEDMTIRSIGHGLSNVIPNIEGNFLRLLLAVTRSRPIGEGDEQIIPIE